METILWFIIIISVLVLSVQLLAFYLNLKELLDFLRDKSATIEENHEDGKQACKLVTKVANKLMKFYFIAIILVFILLVIYEG